MQPDLFPAATESAAPSATLFAEVVFDRPLDRAYSYAVREALRARLAVGKRVRAPFGRGDRATVGYCVAVAETGPARPVKEILEVLDDEALLTDDLLRLTRWMADYYLCGWGQVLNAVIPAGARDRSGTRKLVFLEAVPVAALVAKGVARRVARRVEQYADTSEPAVSTGPIVLNADQDKVWQQLEPALATGGFQAFLLHGVTGSGKTELYLRAIEAVVRQGKEALVLVPEISLTPQTIQVFKGRCPEVAVLHSHLGDAERGGHWRRVAAGQVQVVVGARSSVFAPTRRLGLIVVDEEHEATYKQESTPRYHARDVAVMRARLQEIPIILGSATPSLESLHNARRGQYQLLELPCRVLDRPLPDVGLIDLRHRGPAKGRTGPLSEQLDFAMRAALREGGQVMLLLNRRGFSTHIHCPACGYVDGCQFCDLALTYHKVRDVLLCHYCGFEKEPLRNCPVCGQAAVRYHGLGTEKLQAEIEERFPGYLVERMDSDTMRRPGSHARVLSAFRRGQIHILLGTQMIAKGLDFPNVTLVGVVNADIGLNVPDFRSGERTFQLLSQVAGRTGRGPRGGRVLIQTYTPEHPCIAHAARHDYAGFVTAELATRRAHCYPPYQRLARVILRCREQQTVADFAERLAGAFTEGIERLKIQGGGEVRLLGPAEAPVFRLKGYFRYHFQLQSPSPGALHQVCRAVLPTLRAPAGVEVSLDIDPFQML